MKGSKQTNMKKGKKETKTKKITKNMQNKIVKRTKVPPNKEKPTYTI